MPLKNQDERDDIRAVSAPNPAFEGEEGEFDMEDLSPLSKKDGINLDDMREEALRLEVEKEEQRAKQAMKMKICNTYIYPAITLLMCLIGLCIAASMSMHEADYSYPHNWDHSTCTKKGCGFDGKHNNTKTFAAFCAWYSMDLAKTKMKPSPVVGHCQAITTTMAGCALAFVFTIMSIPPMKRCGKYMCAWAIMIWMSSVVIFAGFVMSNARIPYIVTAFNKTTNTLSRIPADTKYDYSKLWSCASDGYCYDGEFKTKFQAVQSFAFISMVLLFGQGFSAWQKRSQYLSEDPLDAKAPLDETEAPPKEKKKKKEKKSKK